MASDEKTIRSVITPNDQFLRTVFSTSKAYFIDIYQREYKWTPENVETLLRDIEARFSTGTCDQTDPKKIQAAVQEHFEPYFLNTYLTHSTANNIFIVDGQQRLTTFLLILIRLYQILKTFEDEKDQEEDNSYFKQKTFSSNVLEKLIFETDDFGDADRFKIFNENREKTFRQIVKDEQVMPTDETQKRISDNFKKICDYFEDFLVSKDHPDRYDITKITYYITYLLDRISIVEIKIEKQQNVATIFEVVNDRGLGLKPYEILKGKLIGNLPPSMKEKANEVWTQLQNDYFNAEIKKSTESKLDLDYFFSTFFRAKFAGSEDDYEKFDRARDYHYEVYHNPKIGNYFKDFKDSEFLYNRIVKDIKYYAELYLNLRTSYQNEFLIYNKLLDQNQQYLLILSCINAEDGDKEEKITAIARKFEQFHAIMRFLNVYDSNEFQRMLYPINRDIRNRSIEDAEAVFDKALIQKLEEKEVIREGEIKKVSDLFRYERFQRAENRWTNFSKYVLMRIDRHLCSLLDKPSYADSDLEELEKRFNKTTRSRYAMHLEHIYAYNDSNMGLFTDERGFFDEQQFKDIRDRLGMVLLLKDRQNLSSSNEIFTHKVETYKKSNFLWNEMLVGHLHSVDVKRLPEELQSEPVAPDSTGAFPKDKVDERQQLLFNVIKRIWCDSVPSSTQVSFNVGDESTVVN